MCVQEYLSFLTVGFNVKCCLYYNIGMALLPWHVKLIYLVRRVSGLTIIWVHEFPSLSSHSCIFTHLKGMSFSLSSLFWWHYFFPRHASYLVASVGKHLVVTQVLRTLSMKVFTCTFIYCFYISTCSCFRLFKDTFFAVCFVANECFFLVHLVIMSTINETAVLVFK